ncbi:MAG: hypothetical protein L0271_16525 [Gemmatimonadetes bacterium]|nr:hypothetical protein [Gemmatimonadota bacterium]
MAVQRARMGVALGGRLASRSDRGGVALQEMTSALEFFVMAGAEQTIGADSGEAAREHVEQEAVEEVVDRERHAAGFVGPGVSIAEGDLAVGEAFNAVIAERDAIDVAREVQRGVLAPANRLDVHDPASAPDRGIQRSSEAGAQQSIAQLGAEDLRD